MPPGAPDQRFHLSIFRTLNPRRSAKFHLAVTTPAVAVVAALAGTLGAWSASAGAPAAAAGPAAIIRPAVSTGHSSQAGPAGAGLPVAVGTARPAQLDSFLAVSVKAKAKLTPRQIAKRLLGRFHWGKGQFPYLNYLWSRESSWNKHAENPYSGAYGIPQAVPGSKMSTAGRHWRISARTQILWGLKYIKGRYGSPRAAWDHELGTGWY